MLQEKSLVLDWARAANVTNLEKNLSYELEALVTAKQKLLERKGLGAEFTGWLNFSSSQGANLVSELTRFSETVTSYSNAVVVIGIGGSYLGARAVYESLTHSFVALQTNPQSQCQLFWAGHHISSDEIIELLDILDSYSPTLVVISKSGTTTEPALAFRILKNYLQKRFGESEIKKRIFAVTDPEAGNLLQLAKEEQFPTFSIPKNIGGRYSVFTAVGLLPLALAGVNISELVDGAVCAEMDLCSAQNNSLEKNSALCYAGIRNILYRNHFKIEALCTWSPKLKSLAGWWTQLFGESDGKQKTGIFPTFAQFSTDLHSLGQYFQDGERHIIATHLKVLNEYSLGKNSTQRKMNIPNHSVSDGFDFLQGKDLSLVQNMAQQGTFIAHSEGGVPTLVWELPELNAWWIGYWMYTNMFACAVGAYARNINPFDQPGVEDYKVNMFALMGKPGFTDHLTKLKSKMKNVKTFRSGNI